MSHWTVTIEEDPVNGDLLLPFTDEILEAVGWKVGDVIVWTNNKDGTWTMRKKDGTSKNTTE